MMTNCKLCGARIDTDSDMMSPASKRLEVCQEPCMWVFRAARLMQIDEKDSTFEPLTFGEALEELSEGAMFHLYCRDRRELAMPYLSWQIALLDYLLRHPELRNELLQKYNEVKTKVAQELLSSPIMDERKV